MLRPRVEVSTQLAQPLSQSNLHANHAIRPVDPEEELDAPQLPRDHPKWVRDAVAVSQRARQLLATLRPIVIRVLTFWDHRIRALTIGGRNIEIDPSGSYRLSS